MRLRRSLVSLTVLCLLWSGSTAAAETWRGLRVAPESRCSPYLASEYSYPQSIEARIIESLGGIWSPYTGRTFASRRDTDIEHIVARSEAHDSGLCAVYRLRVLGQWFDGIRFYAAASSPRRSRRTWAGLR